MRSQSSSRVQYEIRQDNIHKITEGILEILIFWVFMAILAQILSDIAYLGQNLVQKWHYKRPRNQIFQNPLCNFL